MNRIYEKHEGEDFDEYCHRISSLKSQIENATWDTIASIINEETGNNFSADKYRKQERRYQEGCSKKDEDDFGASQDSTTDFFKETVTTNFEKGETVSCKEVCLKQDQLMDPKELLRAHGYDPDKWIVKGSSHTKSRRSTVSGENLECYSSRITIRPRYDGFSSDEMKELAEYFNNYITPIDRKLFEEDSRLSEDYLVVPLYDFHFGRLPDKNFSGKYDINEEKKKILNHVLMYVRKFRNKKFKKVYLVVGQDFLNSSFTGFTSSQSHLQSNAVDFKTMFKVGAELLIAIVELFVMISDSIKVVGSLGNHDYSEEAALFMLLKAYYRKEEEIFVDDDFAPRKYYKIGNACVGFGHFDKEGKRIFGLMQQEAKKEWAETKTHVLIAGHLHHFSVENENGIELYRIPTICPADKWTNDQGYIMNEPKTMCFVFNETDGLIENHFMFL